MRFVEMMDLAAHGPDTFVGRGPQYPWGDLYGGQIVAQSLRAAAATVDPAYRVHSLHAYFIRSGDHNRSIRFEVDRLRDGRSFVTRSVVARQDAAILHMAASFQIHRPDAAAVDYESNVFDVAPPDGSSDDSWSPMIERVVIPSEPGHAQAWMRVADDLDGDPVLAACALAYLSDDLPSDAHTSLQEPIPGGRWYGTSLDHCVWFARPIPAGWQLHDLRADGKRHPRGLSTGRVYGASGEHLATVAQELLVRRSVDAPGG
ncbi:thioesterase family protein [Acidiferrimicrobium sp. IK]|uniref:acyl-CoA thioesterase n=1 Tax=Acidiferrimicrobium sp. IK TaxID=2871700 RepID=UPI0021CB5EE8|nr:acyl-CoA thioesterase domain-containing protein [Acidiferrimicrobium sp. IK]MCU4183433.1 thioesterase family protein [Acidiferrimicrobium sp. IK]